MKSAWIGKGWAARDAIRQGVMTVVELGVILVLCVWTLAGLVAYGRETGWGMRGLLTLVDEKWRGVLILGFVLFNGSVRMALGRLVSFKIAGHELKLQEGRPVPPTSDPETIP